MSIMERSKKIGIVTLHRSNNYGAMYQVYALSKYLKLQGNDVFVLNYHMERTPLSLYLQHPLLFFRKMIEKRIFTLNFFQSKRQQAKKSEQGWLDLFEEFRNKHLTITEEVYDYQKLLLSCPAADAYVAGSDQVWAADFYFSSPAFLLGFVPATAKRVSYAASFGKNALESYLHKTFAKYLNKFDAVSVREKSGVNIVKQFSENPVTHVLDPTLLMSDYSEITDYSLVPKGDYLLVYRLSQDPQLEEWMCKRVEQLSKQMNLPVFNVFTNSSGGVELSGREIRPTPDQLLGLIDGASAMLTNSFHGVVFSIIFEKKFLAFARDRFEDKQNLRMIELLDSLGLQEKSYCQPFASEDEVIQKIEQVIHYKDVNDKLIRLRDCSEKFLQHALS